MLFFKNPQAGNGNPPTPTEKTTAKKPKKK
jgi:hypothetical protein